MNAPLETAVRRATIDDIDACMVHCEAFHAFGPYAFVPMDHEAFRAFLAGLIVQGAVFFNENGIIAGILNPLYINPAVVMGVELFWFAPVGGRALRVAFEDWAKDQGAKGVQFSSLLNERFDASRKLFERSGFKGTEAAFLKVF